MLSSDILTEFKDRGDEIRINPLTYNEFYEAFEDDKRYAWREYYTYGGMPLVLSKKHMKKKVNTLKIYSQKLIHQTSSSIIRF